MRSSPGRSNDTMKAQQRRPELDHPGQPARRRSGTCTTSTPNGMVPRSTSARKIGSTCLVGMQVQNGKFVRIDPVEPGTFDCDNNKPPLAASRSTRPRNTRAEHELVVQRREGALALSQRWSNLLVWAGTIAFIVFVSKAAWAGQPGQRDEPARTWSCSRCRWRASTRCRRAASSSCTRRPGCSTSPRARSACSSRTSTGSSRSTAALPQAIALPLVRARARAAARGRARPRDHAARCRASHSSSSSW